MIVRPFYWGRTGVRLVGQSLEKAGQKGNLSALRSIVTRHNVGQIGVCILGFTYNIIGIKTRFAAGTEVNAKFDQAPTQSNTVILPGIMMTTNNSSPQTIPSSI